MLERHGAHRKVVKSTSIGAIVLMDGADSKVICHPYHGGIYVAIEHHLGVVGDSDLVPQDLISYFLKERRWLSWQWKLLNNIIRTVEENKSKSGWVKNKLVSPGDIYYISFVTSNAVGQLVNLIVNEVNCFLNKDSEAYPNDKKRPFLLAFLHIKIACLELKLGA